MLKKFTDKNTFYCFSPAVMLGTFIIELLLAIYIIFKQKVRTNIELLCVVILICLAGFQAIEFLLCRSSSAATKVMLAQIGLVFITLLPPLGLHLAHSLANIKLRWYVTVSYFMACGWIVFFSLYQGAVNAGYCEANYAVIDLPERVGFLWGTYYMGLLFIGVWEAYTFSRSKKFEKYRTALRYLVLGYLVFMVPAAVIRFIYPFTENGIPSIMCGFALLLAFTLTFLVIPSTRKK